MSRLVQRITNALAGTVQKLTQECADRVDLVRSRSIPVNECKTVCLALGPYRNLTSLTAAALFLHPHCQVLNHGGDRIFGRRQVDFLSRFQPERLERFMQFAIQISTKGKRKKGSQGGSITLSHAFDEKHVMRDLHRAAGGDLLKSNIQCLFWKESLKTSNLIRTAKVDLATIFKQDNDRLRFLLPIRNPMDCAVSNIKTRHTRLFVGLARDPSVIDVTRAVLNEIAWFADLQARFPTRFFHYFEHDVSSHMLARLAAFLKIEPAPTWLDAARAAMEIKGGYDHSQDVVRFYESYVNDQLAPFPTIRDGLLQFLSTNEHRRSAVA